MRLAVSQANLGVGLTAPNPPVGAVVVKDGIVVGSGYHPKAGEPHAEIFALREAVDQAVGAEIYVTLEPCCHHGSTPPCTEAIIAAGISKVIVGTTDPNPKVAGRGIEILRSAGIEVIENILADECRSLIAPFACHILKSRPLVTLKGGMTLDGKIATATGESQWITSGESRQDVHRFRSQCDAILVGVGTVLSDDPQLTVRLVTGKNPIRVVLDSTLRIPDTAKILNISEAPTVIITTERSPEHKRQELIAKGVAIVVVSEDDNGQIDIGVMLTMLAQMNIMHLLLEGGAEVNNNFLRLGFVDRVRFYIAPMLIGGDDALGIFKGRGFADLNSALRLTNWTVERCGDDMLFRGEVQ